MTDYSKLKMPEDDDQEWSPMHEYAKEEEAKMLEEDAADKAEQAKDSTTTVAAASVPKYTKVK